MSTPKRLARLEAQVGHWPEPAFDLAHRTQQAATHQAAEFLNHLPEACHEELLAGVTWHRLASGALTLAFSPPSLFHLYLRRCRGEWAGEEIMPDAVVAWFLAGAGPWLKCRDCTLPLPYTSGFWYRLGTDQGWQAPLAPYRNCPLCGGTAVLTWNDQEPERREWLPDLPDGKSWEFRWAVKREERWVEEAFPVPAAGH